MKKTGWFKTKKATGIFSLIAFVGGISFLNQGLITGTVVAGKEYVKTSPIFLIGFSLLLCGIFLAFHTIKS